MNPKLNSTKKLVRRVRRYLAYVGIVFLVAGVVISPSGGHAIARIARTMMQTRMIAAAMLQFAKDHDEHYPDGASSTEVFQKLLDGGYVIDPATFYVPLVGKTPARPGECLKPENISFDVTAGADPKLADDLPLVFLSGYRVDYQPGGKAVSLFKPYPPQRRTWSEWEDGILTSERYLAVCYTSTGQWNKQLDYPSSGYGDVRDFLSPTFNTHSQVYRQLTPDGVLK